MNLQLHNSQELAALKASRSRLAVQYGLPPLGAIMVNQYGIEWLVEGHAFMPDLTSLARGNGSVQPENPADLLPIITPQNLSPRLTQFLAEIDRCTCKVLVMLDTMPHLRPQQAHYGGYSVDALSDPEAICFSLDAAHVHETILAHEAGHVWIDLVEDCEDYRVLGDLSDTAKARQVLHVQSFVLDQKVNEVIAARGFDLGIIGTHQQEAVMMLAQAVQAGHRPPNLREAVCSALTIADFMLGLSTSVKPPNLLWLPNSTETALSVLEHLLPGVYSLALDLVAAVDQHGYASRQAVQSCVAECLELTFDFTGEKFDLQTDLHEIPPVEVEQDKWPHHFPGWPAKAKAEVGRVMAKGRIKPNSLIQCQRLPDGQTTIAFQQASGQWTSPILLQHGQDLLPEPLPLPAPPKVSGFNSRPLPERPQPPRRPTMKSPNPLSPVPSVQVPIHNFPSPPSVPINPLPPRGRNYMPGVGRWLSAVRLQEQLQGEHPYTYAFNNPISYVDPDGNSPVPHQTAPSPFGGNATMSAGACFSRAYQHYQTKSTPYIACILAERGCKKLTGKLPHVDCSKYAGAPSGPISCPPRGWVDCFGFCIEANDPLNLIAKGIFTGIGGTFPKAWLELLGMRVTRFAGVSRMTTVPSAISEGLGLGTGNFLRVGGRAVSPLWVAYGNYMALVEARCSIVCYKDPKSY